MTQKFFDKAAIEYLQTHKIEVVLPKLPVGKTEAQLDKIDLHSLLEGAGGWIVGHVHITRDVLEGLPDLAIISRRGVGYEKVDTIAAKELGKVVTIAAGGNDASVADQVIGMMISVGRRFQEAQKSMIKGEWGILVGTELFQKKVGIIGFGRTGRSLAQRLKGFEAQILVSSPRLTTQDIEDYNLLQSDLDTILRESDYISIHAPLTRETHHLIDAEALGKMKSSAILINTGRGGLVDDSALLHALENNQIRGAGLDVYESENDPSKKAITNSLLSLHNVIAAPHAGASTEEALQRTNMIAAKCAVDVILNRKPPKQCVIVDGRKL
ncbi:phosphoglycerate dehydrogenase [Hirschia baltica]|uniref:phosphoglycerate dehydrogenase n=1 Tax=Hirschia baltica TaxID=2724 RepID=UPI00059E0A5C|nr:phosphoglycerate dehydrogenase [Hirschia baltica]